MKLGIQGIEGSFSEQAAKSYCKKFGIEDFELKYLISSMNVLNSLSDKSIDTGIFAMENVPSRFEISPISNVGIDIFANGIGSPVSWSNALPDTAKR